MALEVEPPYPPMEARLVDSIPEGEDWQYEPKWDGFRCVIFRDEKRIDLQSKSCKPLGRYFPDLVNGARDLEAGAFVLDGEILVPAGKVLSFDDLLQRIHPAESRIRRLAEETPAFFVAFDMLADTRGKALVQRPLKDRRPRLESFAKEQFGREGIFRLSPATTRIDVARRWLSAAGGSLDGIVAKRLDLEYRSGERVGMEKIKLHRTADCVVGGFRYGTGEREVGSLLLGLYDDEGVLHHVGFTSGLRQRERKQLTARLEKRIEPPGFTGRAPGGPSRWSTERSMEWEPLRPDLVVEVSYDHFTGGRFRHGTRLLKWRPDKLPRQCTLDQVEKSGVEYGKVLAMGRRLAASEPSPSRRAPGTARRGGGRSPRPRA